MFRPRPEGCGNSISERGELALVPVTSRAAHQRRTVLSLDGTWRAVAAEPHLHGLQHPVVNIGPADAGARHGAPGDDLAIIGVIETETWCRTRFWAGPREGLPSARGRILNEEREILKETGLDVGHRRVGRLMREIGISAVRSRRQKLTIEALVEHDSESIARGKSFPEISAAFFSLPGMSHGC